MKILICNYQAAAKFITDGWINAFRACGHKADRWDGRLESWKAFEPDIYFGDPYYRQEFPRNTNTKIVLHANPYGERLIAEKGHNDCNEAPDAIKWIEEHSPHALWGYGHQTDEKYWRNWKFPWVGMPTGGDAVIHYPVDKDPKYNYDVSFVGGRWGYKAFNIDKYLLPVIKKHKSAVWGWGGWEPSHKYKGKAEDNWLNAIFSSAKVCPAIVEPHTLRYGIDMPERIFKLGLCGAAIVSDPVSGLDRFYSPKAVLVAHTPAQYMEYCERFINNEAERAVFGYNARLETLQNHTYFSRLQPLLRLLGYIKEADEMQLRVDELVRVHKIRPELP